MGMLRLILLIGSLALNLWGIVSIANRADTSGHVVSSINRTFVRTPPIDFGGWDSIAHLETHELRVRLEAEGFPKSFIEAVIKTRVKSTFESKRESLTNVDEYWKEPLANSIQKKRLAKEERELLVSLLGTDTLHNNNTVAALRLRGLGELPLEVQNAAHAIISKYDQALSGVLEYMSGDTFLPSDRATLISLQKAQHRDLAAILSERELEEYELKTTPAGAVTRYQLTGFDASDEEARTLFRMHRELELETNYPFRDISEALFREKMTKLEAINNAFVSTLTPERGAEFKLSKDPNYRQTRELVASLSLPPESAKAIWAIKDESVSKIRGLPKTQAPEARQQALADIYRGAMEQLSTVLPSESAITLYRNNGGNWLDFLARNQAALPKY